MRLFFPHPLSECALPYYEGVPWDGETYSGTEFEFTPRPSASADIYVPVYGPGTHFPIGMTLPELYLFWRAQLLLEVTVDVEEDITPASLTHEVQARVTMSMFNAVARATGTDMWFESVEANDRALAKKESALLELAGVGFITAECGIEISHEATAEAASFNLTATGTEENYLATGPAATSRIAGSYADAEELDADASFIYRALYTMDIFNSELFEFGAFSAGFRVLHGQDGLWYPSIELVTSGYLAHVVQELTSVKPYGHDEPSVGSLAMPFSTSIPLYPQTPPPEDVTITVSGGGTLDAFFPFTDDAGANPLINTTTGAWLG